MPQTTPEIIPDRFIGFRPLNNGKNGEVANFSESRLGINGYDYERQWQYNHTPLGPGGVLVFPSAMQGAIRDQGALILGASMPNGDGDKASRQDSIPVNVLIGDLLKKRMRELGIENLTPENVGWAAVVAMSAKSNPPGYFHNDIRWDYTVPFSQDQIKLFHSLLQANAPGEFNKPVSRTPSGAAPYASSAHPAATDAEKRYAMVQENLNQAGITVDRNGMLDSNGAAMAKQFLGDRANALPASTLAKNRPDPSVIDSLSAVEVSPTNNGGIYLYFAIKGQSDPEFIKVANITNTLIDQNQNGNRYAEPFYDQGKKEWAVFIRNGEIFAAYAQAHPVVNASPSPTPARQPPPGTTPAPDIAPDTDPVRAPPPTSDYRPAASNKKSSAMLENSPDATQQLPLTAHNSPHGKMKFERPLVIAGERVGSLAVNVVEGSNFGSTNDKSDGVKPASAQRKPSPAPIVPA